MKCYRFALVTLLVCQPVMAKSDDLQTSYTSTLTTPSLDQSNKKSGPVPIVTTIHPLYLIASAITQGVEQPVRLLSPQGTGHSFQLTPKQRQALAKANLILWIGPEYETNLVSSLSQNPNAVAVLGLPQIQLLPLRTKTGNPLKNTVDPHIWLSKKNAQQIAWYIMRVRSQQYPQYKAQYLQNYQNFVQQLKQSGFPTSSKTVLPYTAYHDAYQYLEQDNQLNFAGSLVTSEDQTPSANQTYKLIQDQTPSCILVATNAQEKLIKQTNPKLSVAVVSEVYADASSYHQALEQVKKALSACSATTI